MENKKKTHQKMKTNIIFEQLNDLCGLFDH